MNSRWQANKIGLVDFWYYDVEEFYFSEGRMLLRGSNGSGKSVTMQSFIPLLLDGNMRPERLDPFGSRARRMENYLLEENDVREERTGYLYMEFKRTDSNTYLTIGMGMRARKNKKLDPWYFIISDGRRVNIDFPLYKEVGSRIVLTKKELRNRIGEGGQVYDLQMDYMKAVNQSVFGFETLDEYKEMIELLIQLRTPKLSKDFKPSVINEILSSSLQMLTEEDLRPMSEAIENMDGLKTNVEVLETSIDAAKKINRIYDRYNKAVLYEKAEAYQDKNTEYENLEKKNRDFLKKKEEVILGKENLVQKIEHNEQQQKILKEEHDSLDASDAKNLKDREVEIRKQIVEQTNIIQTKTTAYDTKNESRIDVEDRKKKEEEQSEVYLEDMNDMLDEMEELVEEISFEEHVFMKDELLKAPHEDYSFETHTTLLNQKIELVEKAVEKLKDRNREQQAFDIQVKNLDLEKENRDKAERERSTYEVQLSSIKNELVEAIYKWEQENQELKLEKEVLQRAAVFVEQYSRNSEYGELRESIRTIQNDCKEHLETLRRTILGEKEKQEVQIKEKEMLLQEWENQKEPEPECTKQVQRNRQELKKAGVSFIQFYKAMDFSETLSQERRNQLEEALLEMGVLDALIVAAEDKEKIAKLDPGMCDKYLFSDVTHIKENLNDLLEVDNSENDILFYQQVSNALSSIGIGAGHHTAILEDGSYQIGAITGTISKEYEARFIGSKAREKYKQERIQQIREELSVLQEDYAKICERLAEQERRIQLLGTEFSMFPNGEDLKLAFREYMEADEKVKRLYLIIQELEGRVKGLQEKLNELNKEAHALCAVVYLPMSLSKCIEAKEGFQAYKDRLGELKMKHSQYRQSIRLVQGFVERLEEMDLDMDDILYDLNRSKTQLRMLESQLDSVQHQLSLTNYEEIKERLDYCVKQLEELPKEQIRMIQEERDLQNEIVNVERMLSQNEYLLAQAENEKHYLQEGFQLELNLGYVEVEDRSMKKESVSEEAIMLELAKCVTNELKEQISVKNAAELIGDLQGAYHENRAQLVEYQLEIERLFIQEQDDSDRKPLLTRTRVDIVGRYAGVKVKFKELLANLEEDMIEKEALLSSKDRELFEDILANTISKKIRAKIHGSNVWVDKMNELMTSMKTSSGLTLSLKWRSKSAESEEQLSTRELVELLKKDSEIMKEEEVERLSKHFRSKIAEARKVLEQGKAERSFHAIMRDILDYRKWFEFQLECRKTGENKKELTDRVFFTFSGGEKAMAMYVPLFSAVVAKYESANMDAPRLVSLDEAFAGVDEMNIKDMFRLMVEFEFNFIINSQILYGDYETVPNLAIYQLVRPENAKFVSVIRYHWNGKVRSLADTQMQNSTL